MVFIMLFIAVYSFYSGWQLWSLKAGAIKTAKTFLIAQLSLTLVTLTLQQVMISQSTGIGYISVYIMGQLITSVLYFTVWYTYLMKSRRVYNTYGPVERRTPAHYAAA
jgi:hypothetical protein